MKINTQKIKFIKSLQNKEIHTPSILTDFENNEHLKLFIKDIQDSGARFFEEYYRSVGIEDIYGKIQYIPHKQAITQFKTRNH